jgi:AAA15 family ATPase/GTPase
MTFDLMYESAGTLAYLALLGPLVEALKYGGVICVDELDSSLHPLIAIEIMRLFENRAQNPKGGQLIFNTHDTNLLNTGVLRRDQIWFTEKDSKGESHLYPLTDFKPRREENLESGYLQGRYGAIPFIHSDEFVTSLADGDGETK